MEPKETNIRLIIEGCLKNNPISQKRLFELKYGFVMSICNRYSKNSEEAKEMLNDTFYIVFKYIDMYDIEFPFNPWLKKLCINCCLQYKRKYFKNQTLFELQDSHNKIESYETALPSFDDKDYMRLLAKLPQACKTVLNLYVIEEYKHQEIADLLGISVGTSKSNLARAKRLLLKMLEKDSRSRLKFKSNLDG